MQASQKVNDTQGLKCVECEGFFHGVCPSAADKDSQLCNATFLSSFLKSSVKDNFTWTCDDCKTETESNKVATLRQIINAMSKSHAAQITTLTDSINSLADKVNAITVNVQPAETNPTVWGDKARVKKIKSALVVKPDGQGKKMNSNDVRKIVADQVFQWTV